MLIDLIIEIFFIREINSRSSVHHQKYKLNNSTNNYEAFILCLGLDLYLEEEITTHSSILAWKIPWTEQPGGLQSMGSQRVPHDLATKTLDLCCSVK